MKLTVLMVLDHAMPILKVDAIAESSHVGVKSIVNSSIEAIIILESMVSAVLEKRSKKPNGVTWMEQSRFRIESDKLKILLESVPNAIELQQQTVIARDLLQLVLDSSLIMIDPGKPLYWMTVVNFTKEITTETLLEVSEISQSKNEFVKNIAQKAAQVVISILPYGIATLTEIRESNNNPKIKISICHKYKVDSRQIKVWLRKIKNSDHSPAVNAKETIEWLTNSSLKAVDTDTTNNYI